MKKITRIIIVFLCLFIYMSSVKASLYCDADTAIYEKSQASPNNWIAPMPICHKLVFQEYTEVAEGTKDHYQDALDRGDEIVKTTGFAADGKGYVSSEMSMCGATRSCTGKEGTDNEGKEFFRRVKMNVKFSAEKNAFKEDVYCKCNSDGNKNSQNTCENNGCTWKAGSCDAKPDKDSLECSGNNNITACENNSNCKWTPSECSGNDYWCGYNYYCNEGTITGWTLSGQKCEKTEEKTPPYVIEEASTIEVKETKLIKVNYKDDSGKKTFTWSPCTKDERDNYKCTSSVDISYTLECPYCKCEQKQMLVETCSPTFELVDKNTAYCANPDNLFYKEYNNKGFNYMSDPDFSVNDCNYSNDTKDCGYANILIEGAYYNKIGKDENGKDVSISNEAINLALRLWGYHADESGFDKFGLSNRIKKEGTDGCYYYAGFMKVNDEYTNVYEKTYNYIMHNFLSYVTEYYNIHNQYYTANIVELINNKSKLTIRCDSKYESVQETDYGIENGLITGKDKDGNDTYELGVTCSLVSDTRNVYKQGIALFFNTLFGNNEMKKHLHYIYGEEIGQEPSGATIFDDIELNGTITETGEGEDENKQHYSYIKVEFPEKVISKESKIVEFQCGGIDENRIITHIQLEGMDEAIEIAKLDELVKDGTITKEEKEYIEANIDNFAGYCKIETSIVYIDEKTGKEKTVKDSQTYIDRCSKSTGCYTKSFGFAICKVNTTMYRIKVKYIELKSSMSIKKYYGCGPNGIDGYQMMLSYSKPGDSKVEWATKEYPVFNYNCNLYCTYSGVYTNLDKEYKECAVNGSTYNETFNSYIKDPSLKCIVNMKPGDIKKSYDFTSYFKVNNNFCRIYCSDEIEYYIADKVKEVEKNIPIRAGRYFQYDIEKAALKKNTIPHKLSSIIKEKRTCVSKIYYEKNKFEYDLEWLSSYNLQLSGEIKNWIVTQDWLWKDVWYNEDDEKYEPLFRKDKYRDETITWEQVYQKILGKNTIENWKDLYKVLEVKTKGERNRKEILNNLKYDLYNCNLLSSFSGLNYDKNTVIIDYVKSLYENDSGLQNNEYVESGVYVETDVTENNKQKFYASMKPINISYGAKTEGKSINMQAYASNASYTNTLNNIRYCSSDKMKASEESDKIDYNYMEFCNGDSTNDAENGMPNNDYAMFSLENEIDFYNKEEYVVQPNTGNVIRKSSISDSKQKYLSMKKYSYTLDINAYNNKECVNIEKSEMKRCPIMQNFEIIPTYYRIIPNDAFISTVREKSKFKCYVEIYPPQIKTCEDPPCDDPDKSGTLYKNVDLSRIFPVNNSAKCTDNNSEEICSSLKNSNWNKASVIRKIQSTSGNLLTEKKEDGSLEYLQYKIELTADKIKNIKEYNTLNNDYVNEGLTDCTINDEDGTVKMCYSEFLDEMRATSNDGGASTYGIITPSERVDYDAKEKKD